MGDAGPAELDFPTEQDVLANVDGDASPIREVKVLVIGFGPFKSFTVNPSWLIVNALPGYIDPRPIKNDTQQSENGPIITSNTSELPYRIRLIAHPSAVRVAYSTVSTLFPLLFQQHDPDYIFNIGMAGGRRFYTLETQAHRDNYRIKDVDERDGWKDGEHLWKREGCPSLLKVGWDEQDVLEKWEKETDRLANLVGDDLSRNVVRLSTDAGRFLCEFTLFESLSRRWLDAEKWRARDEQGEKEVEEEQQEVDGAGDSETDKKQGEKQKALERLGKAAFLHVPGGHEAEDVARGVRVALAAIQSLVGSWELGKRSGDHEKDKSKIVGGASGPKGRWDGIIWKT